MISYTPSPLTPSLPYEVEDEALDEVSQVLESEEGVEGEMLCDELRVFQDEEEREIAVEEEDEERL